MALSRSQALAPAPSSSLSTGLFITLTVGAYLSLLSVFSFITKPVSDFLSFYGAGRAWLNGTSLYTIDPVLYVNLSPPWMAPVIFAPLARLPFVTAQVIWTVLGALSLASALRVIMNELAMTTRQRLWTLGLTLTSHAVLLTFAEGQTVGVLLYPATRAWMAWRHRHPIAAGLWFVPVVLVKPPLALLPLWLGWSTLLTAALTSAALTGISLLLTGITPWREWVSVGHAAPNLHYAPNVSLWGVAARLHDVHAFADLSRGTLVVTLVMLMFLSWHTWRTTGDARWAAATCWAVFASPIGWMYYLPVSLGAIVATWQRSVVSIIGLGLLAMPYLWIDQIRAVANLYTVGVGCLWWAIQQSSALQRGTVDSRNPSAAEAHT